MLDRRSCGHGQCPQSCSSHQQQGCSLLPHGKPPPYPQGFCLLSACPDLSSSASPDLGGGRWSLRPPSASRGNKKGSPASPSSPASCCDARSRGGPEGPIFAARGTRLGDKGASVIFLKSHPPKCTPTPSLLCQWLKQKKKKN